MNPVELKSANPLISADGNTYKVSSALETIRHFFDQRQDVPLDEAQAFGVGIACNLCSGAQAHGGNDR